MSHSSRENTSELLCCSSRCSIHSETFVWRVKDGGSFSISSTIQSFGSQGWELAGLIDMPDASFEGFTSISSTIKLIFQAYAQPGEPGGIL